MVDRIMPDAGNAGDISKPVATTHVANDQKGLVIFKHKKAQISSKEKKVDYTSKSIETGLNSVR